LAKNIKIKDLSDLELINIYKSENNKSVIGELFKRYVKFVLAICIKYLKDITKSEEAVMQIFENLFTDLLKHPIDNFKSWLHVVTKNHCLQILRKETSQQQKEAELKKSSYIFMESSVDLHHYYINETDEKLNKLKSALNNLSNEQKTCVDLFYLQEKCYNEIATITGYTIKQVKSYIQNGKRNMKIFLTKQQNEE